MSEAIKPTPGPWTVLPEESDKDYLRIRGTRLGARYKVANVHMPRHWESHDVLRDRENAESQANARLIAAAPELLEALQKMLPELRGLSIVSDTAAEMLREAEAAIAKATGEQT